MIITIDGPAASGKTTVARMLAQKLGFYYLSSGLLFRGLAYLLIHEKGYQDQQLIDPRKNDINAVLAPTHFSYHYTPSSGEQLFFNNANITPFLKTENISYYASILALNGLVREALVELQHRLVKEHNVVAEGRDTGSAIFPHADIKFFLTASLTVRAQRYISDQAAKGRIITYEQACHEIEGRDQRDINRALAPLCIPQGALIIDDSVLSKDEVLAMIMAEITARTH